MWQEINIFYFASYGVCIVSHCSKVQNFDEWYLSNRAKWLGIFMRLSLAFFIEETRFVQTIVMLCNRSSLHKQFIFWFYHPYNLDAVSTLSFRFDVVLMIELICCIFSVHVAKLTHILIMYYHSLMSFNCWLRYFLLLRKKL